MSRSRAWDTVEAYPATLGPLRRSFVALLLALAGCAPDQVSLSYQSANGHRLSYHLELNAEIERTLSGQTRLQRVEATFRAEQEVVDLSPEGTTSARIDLRPRSLRVDGRVHDVGSAQEFLVTREADGKVVDIEVGEADTGEALAPIGIERLLSRLQPVLAGGPVAPGASWTAESVFEDASGSFSLSLQSRLTAFDEVLGHPSALVRTTYTSPVERREIFANAVADVEGRDVGTQEAWFALDGFLVRASGDSVGRYRVVFRPPGGQVGVEPVQGRLHVRLRSEMRLLSDSPTA
jgi:hypothetical protein